tara:strand:+ start:2562 stop:4133 length:1572 start_codon:yes stop_codon:yes gene_type:complete
MQKVFFTIGFSLLIILGFSQSKAKTNSAKIYLNAAYVSYETNVNLKEGINKIAIENVSLIGGIQSFSIEKQPGFEFVSTDIKTDYSIKNEPSKEYIILDKKQTEAAKQVTLLTNKLRYLTAEEELILQQKSLLGANSKLLLEDLLEMGDIYRSRLPELSKAIYATQDSLNKASEENRRWLNAKQQLQKPQTFTPYLELTLMCNKAGNYSINFGALTRNIRWTPEYKIENQSGKDQVVVRLNAKVFQNSGIDLNNCQLDFLSSPYISSQQLNELQTQYADYNISKKSKGVNIRGSRAESKTMEMAYDEMEMSAPVSYDDVQTEGLRLFKSSGNVSIPNNNNQFEVALSNNSVPCDKYYIARPELAPYAYLQAEIKSFKDYFPVSANAELWLDNTLNGKTYINPSASEESMNINLGQDQQISVSRQLTENKSRDANILRGTKLAKTYKININSGKTFEIDLRLEDRYPISNNESIEVELEGISGSKNNTDKGILQWQMDLKAKDSKQIVWGYSIKHDANKNFGIR